ncbi:hypothetical protein HHK36_023858 [Tetracentron sinense]|uniref:Senescence regulator n=1 Tax=Tetracentron sinense TaxID=13715 RepID=A0A834YT70_TETSI|nr:hypothetical protein HHK36_023858 [Tetracentron sinense]
MAKGRKLGSSRHERWLESFGYNQGQETGTDGSELGEEDVWSMIDRDDHYRHVAPSEWSSPAPESNGNGAIRRWIARENRHIGGLSLAFDDAGKTQSSRIVHNMVSPREHQMAASAPVNVPDWSKILRVNSAYTLHDSDDELEDREMERVPPHEYLAREYARRHKMAETSVFEGVGRTLKGRDLSRVRDAVWSQTGFDG